MKNGGVCMRRGAWGARAMAASLGLALSALPVAAKDVAGSSDHPLVGRYQGAQIAQYNQKDFDEVRLPNSNSHFDFCMGDRAKTWLKTPIFGIQCVVLDGFSHHHFQSGDQLHPV